MQYIDIFVNIITLMSGVLTAILGYLLYLKYRVKAIRHYALFILTTTFTVAFTTINSYMTNNTVGYEHTMSYLAGFFLFQFFLICINYGFARFARAIIHKSLSLLHKALIGIPCFFLLLSVGILCGYNIGRNTIVVPLSAYACFAVILACLFLTFVICSIQIAINLKSIGNSDLKRALKVMALLFIVYIPIQTVVIIANGQWVIIMLCRNIFYLLINVISILFAAKYFFVQAPTIMGPIEVMPLFINKYAITRREKEVIELLLSGLSIKEIGAKLDRSFKTVNNHIYNIYQKTGVGNKIELLNLVKENQI